MESEGKEIERRDGKDRRDSFLRDILDNLDQYAFGIITQHGYRELTNRLDEHAAAIEDRFHKWFIRGLVVFGVMGIACVVALAGYGVVLDKFQSTRKAFIRDSCLAQNSRHDKTKKVLLDATSRAERKAKTEARRKRIRKSTQVSIALIDSLAPVQDCDKLAEVAVGEAEPPPPQASPRESP